MEHHRNNEGNSRLHFKYTRLQYKLRDTGYALVSPREEDLPGIIKTGQIRFQNNLLLCYFWWLDSKLRNRCKKNDENDSGISRSRKICDQGCISTSSSSRRSPVPRTTLPLNNNNCLDLLILKLDKISQKIELTVNQELFRHHHLLSNYSL